MMYLYLYGLGAKKVVSLIFGCLLVLLGFALFLAVGWPSIIGMVV